MQARLIRQRGVTLVFSLLALVALTMGAVALIRAVDTNVLALGNLAFKQSGLTAGGRAAQVAMDWLALKVETSELEQDIEASGYYATSLDTLDPSGVTVQGGGDVQALVDWDNNGCKVNGAAVAFSACIKPSAAIAVGAESVRYLVTRLCRAAGPPDPNGGCARPPITDSVEGSNHGQANCYNGNAEDCMGVDQVPATMYRVITRSLGPKGTVTFTETMAHF